PHRETDLLRRVAFVQMNPSLHREHAPAGERPDEQVPGVALHRREREARDIAVRNAGFDDHLVRHAPKAGTKDDGDIGHERRPRPHGADRGLDHSPCPPPPPPPPPPPSPPPHPARAPATRARDHTARSLRVPCAAPLCPTL